MNANNEAIYETFKTKLECYAELIEAFLPLRTSSSMKRKRCFEKLSMTFFRLPEQLQYLVAHLMDYFENHKLFS